MRCRLLAMAVAAVFAIQANLEHPVGACGSVTLACCSVLCLIMAMSGLEKPYGR